MQWPQALCRGGKPKANSTSVFTLLLFLAEGNCSLHCRSPMLYSSDSWVALLTCWQHNGGAGNGGGIIKKKLPKEHVHPQSWECFTGGSFLVLVFHGKLSRTQQITLTWPNNHCSLLLLTHPLPCRPLRSQNGSSRSSQLYMYPLLKVWGVRVPSHLRFSWIWGSPPLLAAFIPCFIPVMRFLHLFLQMPSVCQSHYPTSSTPTSGMLKSTSLM